MTQSYAISFYTSGDGRYCGLYSLPGNPNWRVCMAAGGGRLHRATAQEAEADAGHALTLALNRQLEAAR